MADHPSSAGDDLTPKTSGETPAPEEAEPTVVIRHQEAPPIETGSVLGHTYRIEGLLGKGGMGAVYRARHVELASEHAIKVILTELAKDPQIVALLNHEAQTLRSVKDDAVVEYQGLMLDEFGRRYLVMEFVDGPSLASELRKRRFSPQEVRRLRGRLARGLGAAHAKGIFHRDVSPDNVILPNGQIDNAKLIDFGIAKSTETGERTIIGGDFAGKYSYASPEQTGMFDGKIDARSDIYALGLVLAAAAIGHGGKLNMGQLPSEAYRARQSVPDLSRVPQELRRELTAMLQPDPRDRPQSMDAVLALGGGKGGARGTAKGGAAAGQLGRILGAAAVLVLIALFSAGIAYAWLGWSGWPLVAEREPPPAAPNPAVEAAAGTDGNAGQDDTTGGTATTDAPPASGSASTAAAPPPAPEPPPPQSTAVAAATPPPQQVARPAPQPPATPTPPPVVTPPPPPPAQQTAAVLPPPVVTPSPPPAPSPPPQQTAAAPPPMSAAARRQQVEQQLRQALRSYSCAAVTGSFSDDGLLQLDGLMPHADDLASLQRAVSGMPDVRLANRVLVGTVPQCQAASMVQTLTESGHHPPAPQLRFNQPDRTYRDKDILILDVTATPKFGGYLYVDYFDPEGTVVHMLPASLHGKNAVKAGESVTLGAPREGGKTGQRVYEISEPFGPALITAISSPRPLFPSRTQEMEEAGAYLAVLQRAVREANGAQDGPVAASYAVVNTVPR